MEELNNKKDITGKINNAILTCDNENTDMKDTTLDTTLVGASVGTTLGTISVGASEGTALGENYNSNSVGAQVGSTLSTTSVDNRKIPSRHEIMETSTFGKTSKDHSFTSEACFEHTLIFVLKGGFLADTEQKIY